MKNKLYNIIYLSGLLIDNQANVDSDIYEMNNTIIPEDIIIPKTVIINQKINIDMDLFVNSKLLFVSFTLCCFILLQFLISLMRFFFYKKNNIMDNLFQNFNNLGNSRIGKPNFTSCGITFIIIILRYIVIVIINTNKYTSKYMKQNALFKSWCLHMLLTLIYLLVVIKGWTDLKHKKFISQEEKSMSFKDILPIFNIFGERRFNIGSVIYYYAPFILGMRNMICTFIINNIILITSYYMLKRYYQKNPIKYKEKRDYINSLNNPTPTNVLDNNLDTPANVLDNNLIVENNII